MWLRWAARLAVALLKNARLDIQTRQLLTTALLVKLGALPIRAKIYVDEAGQTFVDGKQLNLATSKRLYETSKVMLNNFARNFVREQVTFLAIRKGIHENTTPEEGLFAKAALWSMDEEDKLYRAFALVETEEDGQ